MGRIFLVIEGMHCADCEGSIKRKLQKVPGVDRVSVHFASNRALIEGSASPSSLIKAIQSAGYGAKLISGGTLKSKAAWHTPFLSFCFSALLTIPLWMGLPRWSQWLLATLVQTLFGARFYKGSFYSLKRKSANMDLLIALGTSAAYLFSTYVVLFGRSEPLYFESSASVITLILLGRFLEELCKTRAADAVQALMELQPATALVQRQGVWEEVPIEEIALGEFFKVKPGEKIPLDGEVIEGGSHVDESLLTGESALVKKHPGERVLGGTQNQEGVLIIKTTAVGEHTLLFQMIQLVSEAQQSRPPIQKLVDRISNIFVPCVVAVAALTFIAWWTIGSLGPALIHSVAVLVIACPCALGLATPLVLLVAVGIGAKQGILLRNVNALQEAAHLQRVAFDKTGTLTQGKLTLSSVHPPEILPYLIALEAHSEHPIAAAITKNSPAPFAVQAFEALPGRGIQGFIQGQVYFLGSTRLMEERSCPLPPSVFEAEREGKTVICLARENEFLGFATLEDPLRADAKEGIQALHAMHIQTLLLTGDHPQAAEKIARMVGIDEVYARLLPAEKVQKISLYPHSGMVGDGINDAAALARATVGFAVATGTDLAKQAADITLMRPEILLVAKSIQLSKKALRKIWQNLFFAFLYNAIGIPIAALGLLSPLIAAGAMAASSLCVIGNALLLQLNKESV